jgi:aminopeptidase YwaD
MNKYAFFALVLLSILPSSCSIYKYTQDISESDLNLHVNFLASDELEGRYPGTIGDSLAGIYIQDQFKEVGLSPEKQEFPFLQAITRGPDNQFEINGIPVPETQFTPFPFSKDTLVMAPVVFAGYGITVKTDSFSWNDYDKLDIKNQWVLVLRGTPGITEGEDYLTMCSEDRDKAMLARDNGAGGVLLVSGYKHDSTDILVSLSGTQASMDIPVMQISRSIADSMLKSMNRSVQILETAIDSAIRPMSFQTPVLVKANSSVKKIWGKTNNWYALLEGSKTATPIEYVVIGAHYDHLGTGGNGSSSRNPDTTAVHNGADDNASGVSAMLELAGKLKASQAELKRSVIFVAFGAEEMGLLGSKYFVNHSPVDLSGISAMINLDMIGRLDTAKGLQVGGAGTSLEADSLIKLANEPAMMKLTISREGSGPSDHSSFYGRNIPVFFITTGAHADYHTPDDDPEFINTHGLSQVTDFIYRLVLDIADNPDKLTFREAGPKENASPNHRFRVTLGFMPDFSASDLEGVRVDIVSKGKAAERGGIKNGDIITAIDGKKIKNIYDYMYRLSKLRKNQIISVELMRNGKLEVLIIQL